MQRFRPPGYDQTLNGVLIGTLLAGAPLVFGWPSGLPWEGVILGLVALTLGPLMVLYALWPRTIRIHSDRITTPFRTIRGIEAIEVAIAADGRVRIWARKQKGHALIVDVVNRYALLMDREDALQWGQTFADELGVPMREITNRAKVAERGDQRLADLEARIAANRQRHPHLFDVDPLEPAEVRWTHDGVVWGDFRMNRTTVDLPYGSPVRLSSIRGVGVDVHTGVADDDATHCVKVEVVAETGVHLVHLEAFHQDRPGHAVAHALWVAEQLRSVAPPPPASREDIQRALQAGRLADLS